jgi:DNA polymerase elongation subunit (family B)
MPSILQNLLAARKATRVKAKYKTITTQTGDKYSGLLNESDNEYTITDVTLVDGQLNKNSKTFNKSDIVDVTDSYNSFMKNIFNQRQASIKVVANSLYGQCGAKTSSFYEMDIAASTTATGRKLLIYGQKIIENAYIRSHPRPVFLGGFFTTNNTCFSELIIRIFRKYYWAFCCNCTATYKY